jgi:hypothetical protein
MFCLISIPGHNILITKPMAGLGRNGALEFITIHKQPFILPHSGGHCDLLHVASASQTKSISQGAILQNDNPTQYMIDMGVIVAFSL